MLFNYAGMAFHPCLEFYESTIDEELQEGEQFVIFERYHRIQLE